MNNQVNVMVLGQSGVGKSSLINYLADKEVCEVGTGSPVTQRGKFQKVTFPSPNNSDVSINVYDSWGLESNKTDDWKKVIDEKLLSTLSFDKMISGIVYCMSYQSDRIQDFELDYLKDLLSYGYEVIVVLTQADNSGYETKKTVYRERLEKGLPEEQRKYVVVDVCAEAHAKPWQAPIEPFGRDKLLDELQNSTFYNFNKVFHSQLKKWRSSAQEKIQKFETECIESAKRTNFEDKMEISGLKDLVSNRAKALAKSFTDEVKAVVTDASEYYELIEDAFAKPKNNAPAPDTILSKIGQIFDKIANLFGGGVTLKNIEEFNRHLEETSNRLDDLISTMFEEIDDNLHERLG
ncbi:hypothetical protein RsTz2092_07360 [Deferribacterales bacterium RsTz2092]|nr:hypothetical protein AGMMS49941_07310 [Deferribacterales bacterium]